MLPSTKYVRCGDLHIAYQVVGEGDFDLIYVPGWVSHVELAWEEPIYARFLSRLASFSRLITFDKRGTGLSDRVPLDALPTLEERMDDLKCVMNAVNSEKAALFGFSEGGNLCALFAATYPEKTRALILFGIFAKRIWSEDYPWAPTPEAREKEYRVIEEEWGNEMDLANYIPSKIDDKGFVRRLAAYFRSSASPSAAVTLLKMNTQIDIRDILPLIQAPTLVIHRTDDLEAKVAEGRWIARKIPNARFLELPGADHIPWVGDQDAVLVEIQEFLTGVRPTGDFDRVLSTILFTDIVGSTRMAVQLGDREWKSILEKHHVIIRQKINEFSGQEIDTAGDGFVIVFDGPVRAVKCAMAIIQACQEMDILIRAGIHAGEIHKVGSDISGLAVHIAARVVDKAEGGEVVVTKSVKDLAVSPDLEYADLGEFDLKGVPERWKLFRVEASGH